MFDLGIVETGESVSEGELLFELRLVLLVYFELSLFNSCLVEKTLNFALLERAFNRIQHVTSWS